MKKTFAFQNMPHSEPLEQHALQKLVKLEELLKREKNATPMHIEVFLKSGKPHPHHRVELILKTPNLSLNSHEEHPDMYIALDNAVDKMVSLVKKSKERSRDKERKAGNAKEAFSTDKYTLSEEPDVVPETPIIEEE